MASGNTYIGTERTQKVMYPDRYPRMPKNQSWKFCIIIPMYNEAGNVLPTINAINHTLKNDELQADIVCVNDGSTDTTGQELAAAANKWSNTIVLTHENNRGFGAARRTAMKFSTNHRYEYVLFMDADLTMNPKYLIRFNEKIIEGFDFVIGSRFIHGGGMKNVPRRRRIVSIIGNLVFRICFRLGLHDYSQGFRAIRMSIVKQLYLKEVSFPIVIEELIQARQITHRFTEVPFVLTTRNRGLSKFSWTPRILFKYIHYAGKAFITSFS